MPGCRRDRIADNASDRRAARRAADVVADGGGALSRHRLPRVLHPRLANPTSAEVIVAYVRVSPMRGVVRGPRIAAPLREPAVPG